MAAAAAASVPPFPPMLFPPMHSDRKTPVRQMHSPEGSIKISPPSGDEASNHLRPSPARPIPINLQPSTEGNNNNNDNHMTRKTNGSAEILKRSNEDLRGQRSPSIDRPSVRSKGSLLSIEELTRPRTSSNRSRKRRKEQFDLHSELDEMPTKEAKLEESNEKVNIQLFHSQ